ncbi:PH domain-containing protein [Streptomyces sp. DSM 42041]|uniref:PH domain-containing protein n=1 Tax=Streptomyces hazeniae TaxID=3075538 RepID=A0ABU2NVA8_9ACTN|nr:PH domain-containing protein [Streptomyces sp. DSM 42041]MDT0380911.1 PH domain-containing protein [Streptomyces sp. DSM 42041]
MTSQNPPVADRCYRSPAALAAGVALLAIALWLGSDALIRGSGRQQITVGAGLLCFVPLVVAFTLRPAVFAGRERLRVRNPFRTISMSWQSVDSLRSGYTSEVVADGTTYQLWSVPVSLRARKAAIRHNARVDAGHKPSRGLFGVGLSEAVTGEGEGGRKTATSDSVIHELRDLAAKHGEDGTAPAPSAPVTVRWAYEVLAPLLVGAAGLAYVLAT